jgi:pimeloyl-ACP methyl ester carboxylesterase
MWSALKDSVHPHISGRTSQLWARAGGRKLISITPRQPLSYSLIDFAIQEAPPMPVAMLPFRLRTILIMIAGVTAGTLGPAPLVPGPRAEDAGHYADLPGVKLWLTDTGGTGTPVVLLHANTGIAVSWETQAAAFSRAGYRVIAFDRRGWGKSMADSATGPQPGSVAGDLAALADHLGLDRFHLVGVAGGGFAAIDYAAWHPERLRSLVVGASTGQFSEREIEDFRARVQFPELGRLPVLYREVGPSYRGGNPEGTRRWTEIEAHSQQPGAGPAAADAEHLRQARHRHHAGAGSGGGCRPARPALDDAGMGGASQELRVWDRAGIRALDCLGAARGFQRKGAGLHRAALE